MPRWTPERDARLRELWAQPITREAIGLEFGLTGQSVRHHAQRLGLPPKQPSNRPCTKEADIVLARLWAEGASSRQIAKQIGVNKSVVLERAKRLGLPPRTHKSNVQISRSRWTPELDDKLRRMWASPMMRVDIACDLSMKVAAIDARAARLKLPARRTYRVWTADEDTELREFWMVETVAALAVRFAATVKSIRHRAGVLGLPQRPRGLPGPKPRKAATPRAPKPKALPVVRKRVVQSVFVQPRDSTEFHDSPVAADKLDTKMSRARGLLASGRDPIAVCRVTNLPLREVYRLAGEVRAA